MMEKEELLARIEGLEQELAEERIRREITETHEEDKAEFYLVSVIVSGVREENAGK